MLTLQSQRNEDHLPYLSQSEYPGKGTPVGRRSDDPRRKHTGDANTGHSARGRDRRERRVPGSGHLGHAVLSLGATSQSLWRRGVASASSGCSRRLSLSTGGWSSAASTSPVARRSIAASAGSWSSTTSNGRIMDIGPWADPGDALSRRGRGGPLTSCSTLGRRTCQHRSESGHPSLDSPDHSDLPRPDMKFQAPGCGAAAHRVALRRRAAKI